RREQAFDELDIGSRAVGRLAGGLRGGRWRGGLRLGGQGSQGHRQRHGDAQKPAVGHGEPPDPSYDRCSALPDAIPAAAPARLSIRPEIIRPAGVWSTLVTVIDTSCPIEDRPCSITTIVPSSR